MRAFEYAARLGYLYLETDARSTADGKIVAFHDATLDRATDRTGAVSRLPWREVRAARISGTEEIPLLEDLIGSLPENRFNIDLKDAGTARLINDALRRTRAWDRVCISSFSGGRLVAAQRSLDRPVCLALPPVNAVSVRCFGPPGQALAARLARLGVRCAQVPPQVATRGFIRRAHGLGLDVHVWTLNTRAEITRALDLGVQGIMTDNLTLLRDILIERAQWHPAPTRATASIALPQANSPVPVPVATPAP